MSPLSSMNASAPRSHKGRLFLALCFFVFAAFYLWLRHYDLPAPTGPYAVGTTIIDLEDATRSEEYTPDPDDRRELVVQIWYPAAPSSAPLAHYKRWTETTKKSFYEVLLPTHSRWSAPLATPIEGTGKPFPVLLFGHRWNGQRTQDTALIEDLASHGYVVAAIDHPYNSQRVALSGHRVVDAVELMNIDAPAKQQLDQWNHSLETWARDDIFVLNQLALKNTHPNDLFYNHLDTSNVGAFGHSFGGAASIRLCGMDPRIKAAVNMDGWMLGSLSQRTAAQPVLLYYGTDSVERRRHLDHRAPSTANEQLNEIDDALVDKNLATYGGYRLFINGVQHLDFTDQPLLPPLRHAGFTGPMAPRRVDSLVRSTMLDFFNTTLLKKPAQSLLDTLTQYPEVTVENWKPTPAK